MITLGTSFFSDNHNRLIALTEQMKIAFHCIMKEKLHVYQNKIGTFSLMPKSLRFFILRERKNYSKQKVTVTVSLMSRPTSDAGGN